MNGRARSEMWRWKFYRWFELVSRVHVLCFSFISREQNGKMRYGSWLNCMVDLHITYTLYEMWHGFSWKFHVISCHKSAELWSKSTQNSMSIPCHLSRFYLFFMLEHDMDFGQVQVMEFPWHLIRKWWDSRQIYSQFRPNSRQEDMRNSLSHFL